nr:very short patch repair endonuclease [uncultured Bacteroides sp.]
MSDVHSKGTRSYNMSMIKGKNTKPEMIVRKYLFSKGFRYRVNVKKLPGKPDIVLHKYRTVIFINGCFWHGHKDCKYFVMPKTRTEWWKAKIDKNIVRDAEVRDKLRSMGWRTMVVWECQLKPKQRENTLSEIASLLEKTFLELYKN